MRTARKGVALVSVIVAAGILAIAIGMAASALITSARIARQALNLTKASNFVEATLETTRLKPFDFISTHNVAADLPKLPGARCTVEASLRERGLKEVTVTFTWREREHFRTLQLSTLVAKGAVK